jgi:hypothetical protein
MDTTKEDTLAMWRNRITDFGVETEKISEIFEPSEEGLEEEY